MRIVAAMSGGVDSSVAAALLAEAGHEVIGLSMQLYDQREGRVSFGSCCTLDDLHDARRVAAAIGIPHYILNLERQFEAHVVDNFVSEYRQGRTPLPCARCNSELKFDALMERARGLGADAVATGHYARVERPADGPRYLLRRGLDAAKDQSYFLFSLTQAQLARALFPLGSLTKPEVRALARERHLPVADKRDSHEICFVANDDYAGFIERRAPESRRAGLVVDTGGHVVGRHEGVHRFTIGQRKGLHVSGRDADGGRATGTAAHTPLYVTAIRAADNTVVVGSRDALARGTLAVSGVNWIAGHAPSSPLRTTVQIRSRHAAAPATLHPTGAVRAKVEFDEPQSAITPGQAAVFYVEDEVIGGGWID
jgi:tRNA-uridine 2-sulfurtransferase